MIVCLVMMIMLMIKILWVENSEICILIQKLQPGNIRHLFYKENKGVENPLF